MESYRQYLNKKVHKKIQASFVLVAASLLVGCQTVPPEEETVETVETTVYIERQPATGNSKDSNVTVVKEKKKVAPARAPKTLSVLQVPAGQGCPSRDPNSYGVFLKSERVQDGLLCYYD